MLYRGKLWLAGGWLVRVCSVLIVLMPLAIATTLCYHAIYVQGQLDGGGRDRLVGVCPVLIVIGPSCTQNNTLLAGARTLVGCQHCKSALPCSQQHSANTTSCSNTLLLCKLCAGASSWWGWRPSGWWAPCTCQCIVDASCT
jgi:hypothetical protein